MLSADSIPPPATPPQSAANPANPAVSSPPTSGPLPPASPPLSPRDSALLSSLIRTNFDLSQVAFDHGLGLHELTDWLRSPAIQALAADLLHSAHTFLEIRLARARMATVGILETIAQTSDDPTERRRAATALFHRPFARPKNPTYRLYNIQPAPDVPPFSPSRREGAGGGQETAQPVAPPRAPKTDSPSSPAGGGAAAPGGGGGSLSTPSTNAPSSSGPSPAPYPTSAAPSSPCHPATVSPCPPSSLPACPASPTPSSPRSLASSLFNAFFARDTKALLHAFSAHSTPAVTLDGRPLRETLHTHPLAQMHISREVAYSEHARSANFAAYTFTFDRAPLVPARASFRFEFARDDRDQWFIHRITTLDSS